LAGGDQGASRNDVEGKILPKQHKNQGMEKNQGPARQPVFQALVFPLLDQRVGDAQQHAVGQEAG
jgi:hypothetical protein